VSCGSGACAGKIGAMAGAAAMPSVLLLWVSLTAALLGAADPLTWASSGAVVVGTNSCFVSMSSGAADLSPDRFPTHEGCISAVSNEAHSIVENICTTKVWPFWAETMHLAANLGNTCGPRCHMHRMLPIKSKIMA